MAQPNINVTDGTRKIQDEPIGCGVSPDTILGIGTGQVGKIIETDGPDD